MLMIILFQITCRQEMEKEMDRAMAAKYTDEFCYLFSVCDIKQASSKINDTLNWIKFLKSHHVLRARVSRHFHRKYIFLLRMKRSVERFQENLFRLEISQTFKTCLWSEIWIQTVDRIFLEFQYWFWLANTRRWYE